ADTKARLLQATDDALQKHGYADLSMAKVADEFDGSQSLIHYHFDSREGLLAAYVAWKRDQYREFLDEEFPEDPDERVTALVTTFVREFTEWANTDRGQAMMDLYAEGRDSDAVAEELRRLDGLFRDAFREAVADGVEAGVFRDVDPDAVARLLLAASDGTAARWSVGEGDEGEPIADAVEQYLLDQIRVDGN
ncbi:MAG: TetR/AcrR family transcriptional regulator, partial [Bradymonadaceae bacterium]